jgi:2-methylcitrate dehydratase PrpD
MGDRERLFQKEYSLLAAGQQAPIDAMLALADSDPDFPIDDIEAIDVDTFGRSAGR